MKVFTKKQNPKISRKELKFAAQYMYHLLVSERAHEATSITIESRNIKRSKHTLQGQTSVNNVWERSPKSFTIVLNSNISKKNQLLTLAHELVHCKQFYKNELGRTTVSGAHRFTKWKRRLVNESTFSYWDLAWEIEANGREYGLYKRYTNFVKANRLKF